MGISADFSGIQAVFLEEKLLNAQQTSLLKATEHLHGGSTPLVHAQCEDVVEATGMCSSLVNGNSLLLNFQRQ